MAAVTGLSQHCRTTWVSCHRGSARRVSSLTGSGQNPPNIQLASAANSARVDRSGRAKYRRILLASVPRAKKNREGQWRMPSSEKICPCDKKDVTTHLCLFSSPGNGPLFSHWGGGLPTSTPTLLPFLFSQTLPLTCRSDRRRRKMRGVFRTRCADQEWIGCGSERREEGERHRDVTVLCYCSQPFPL